MRRYLFFTALCVVVAAAPADVPKKTEALKRAVAARDLPGLLNAAAELLAEGTEAAVQNVIRYAFLCDDYTAERRVAGALAALPLELRPVVQSAAVRSERFETRIILAAVLAAYDDDGSFMALGALIRDPVPQVALAAVSHLARSAAARNDFRAVDAFIAGLERYQGRHGVLEADIHQALTLLTGHQCESAAEWKLWWEPRRNTFKPEDARGNVSRPRRTVVRPRTFFGHEVVSSRILFILDMSGSMKIRDLPPDKDPRFKDRYKPGTGAKGRTGVKEKEEPPLSKAEIERLKKDLPKARERLFRVQRELNRTIDSLGDDVQFTVMAYNHEIKLLTPTPQRATQAFKTQAKRFVDSFEAEGETHTDTALERTFEMRGDGVQGRIDTIYLLSDGSPQRAGKLLPEGPILEYAKEANRFFRMKIHTVGFLQEGGRLRRFLTQLAADSGGIYKELE